MARAQEISIRIGSLKELLEIVGAIRAMAAVQLQQSQRSLGAVRDYIGIIRRALADAAGLLSSDDDGLGIPVEPRPGLVVFCSEHGFCGGFNELLIRVASEASRSEANLHLIFVGTRGAQRALEHGLRPELTLPMATHSGGVTAAARRVAAELYRRFLEQACTSVDVLFAREVAGHRATLERLRLLPLGAPAVEEKRSEIPPIVNLKPRRLFDELAAEYMFAMLEAAAMESFASENAARFRTMEAAHENIENKSSELNRMARRIRQESVTTEILDLIGGFEAMKRR
ncbi:MAG TPA: FoF1 ATP synthase subunit gamma [Candidatus Binataceae bacterium]|nr:FoF1 ATP synthase subunit gamma [Candidatus Binataceae bacterium]